MPLCVYGSVDRRKNLNAHLECGRHHIVEWGPGVNTRRRQTENLLCSLNVNIMWLAASCSYHQKELYSRAMSYTKFFLPKIAFIRFFSQQQSNQYTETDLHFRWGFCYQCEQRENQVSLDRGGQWERGQQDPLRVCDSSPDETQGLEAGNWQRGQAEEKLLESLIKQIFGCHSGLALANPHPKEDGCDYSSAFLSPKHLSI